MIDTICLRFPKSDFTISNYDGFENPDLARKIMEDQYIQFNKNGLITCPYNPTKADKISGYKPYLTLVRVKNRKADEDNVYLRVRFSIPKLIYNNNFDEISGRDFIYLVDKLWMALEEMSIQIPWHYINSAEVVEVHYSKNIIFNDGTPCDFILDSIKKADISRRLDVNESKYRNNGHSVKYHTNSYELIFYDKLKDLQAAKVSDKRAIEDDNGIQLKLLDDFQKNGITVFRMECRLNNKEQIKRFLGKVGMQFFDKEIFDQKLANIEKATERKVWDCDFRESYKAEHDQIELIFYDLFSDKISKMICLHFWSMIEDNLPAIVLSNNDTIDLYNIALLNKYKPRDALCFASGIKICEAEGQRKLRNMLGRTLSNKIITMSSSIDYKNNFAYETLLKVKKALEIFDPIKVHKYYNESPN